MPFTSLAQGNTWSTKESMQIPRFQHGACVVNGKIYAIGGTITGNGFGSPGSATGEVYDPSTNTWSPIDSMPTPRESLSLSAVNGKIYAIGGDSFFGGPGELSTVEEYDPATDTWSPKTSMASARTGLSSNVVNGKIYAIGGLKHSTGEAVDDVEEYDPITDTWSPKAPMPTARAWFSSSVFDGKIYVFGGVNSASQLKSVQVYDPVTDTWDFKNDMPDILSSMTACTANDFIYLFGGLIIGIGTQSDVWKYNPISDTWAMVSQLPLAMALSSPNSPQLDGEIYIIGGCFTWINGNPQPTSTVWGYTPPMTGLEDHSWNEHNPEEFGLHQNYPNPFNPSTNIGFRIADFGFVSLTIYNVTGEKVETLVSENLAAGSYEYQWNARGLASGVYYYRLETDHGFMQTKKMLLIR